MSDGITKAIEQYVNSPSYVWLPIVVAIVIVGMAAMIGWINGWKTSLYFAGWNVAALVSGVLLMPTIISTLDEVDFLKAFITSAQELFGILLLFLYIIVMNFIAFLFYWIFRRKLKKSIKDNKKAGKSNFSTRFIGMSIAVASASPAAVFLADTSAVMSTENGYTKFLDKLTKGFTGGKYHGTSEARVIVGNMGHIADFVQAITGDIGKFDINDDATKTALKDVLSTDVSKNLDDIYNSLDGIVPGLPSRDELQKPMSDDDLNKIPQMDLELPNERREQLTNSLKAIFGENNVGKIMAKILKNN